MSTIKWKEEDVARWQEKIAGGMTMRGVARDENISAGTIAGVFKRHGIKTPRKTKRQDDATKECILKRRRIPKRPDQDTPERDGPSLIELGPKQCHFPVTWDKPFKFCGEKTNGLTNYCQHHYERSVRAETPPLKLNVGSLDKSIIRQAAG